MTAIDLFAGAGGFSLGARAAGLDVIWAANHWRSACDVHAAAFPTVQHACEDLHRIDWTRVPAHDVLLAAPCCQGHTPARGKERPHHDSSRSTAWAVIDCAETHLPGDILVENVPKLMDWVLYPAWRSALMALGYSVAESILDAADVGVPQHRIRLFVHASRRGPARPIVLPPLLAHRPASSFIQDLPLTSLVRSLCPRSRARARQGRRDHGERFLLPYYSSARTGRSLHAPIGTITTRARYALVDGPRIRMLAVEEIRAAMGFPADYPLPMDAKTAIHLLGNAVPPPLAAAAIRGALAA